MAQVCCHLGGFLNNINNKNKRKPIAVKKNE